MIGHDATQATRYMAIGSTSGTFYPTGVQLGIFDATGVPNNNQATRDGTNTNSWYAINSRDPTSMKYGAIIKRIAILTAGSAASVIQVQGHAGAAYTPNIAGDVVATHDFGDGFRIYGGFRVVTTGATGPIIAIIYDLIGT